MTQKSNHIKIHKLLTKPKHLNSFIEATNLLHNLFTQNIKLQLFTEYFCSLTNYIRQPTFYDKIKNSPEIHNVTQQFFKYPTQLQNYHLTLFIRHDTDNIFLTIFLSSTSPLIHSHLTELAKYPEKLKVCSQIYEQMGKKFNIQETNIIINNGHIPSILSIFSQHLTIYTITNYLILLALDQNHYEILSNYVNQKNKLPQNCVINAVQTNKLSLLQLFVLSGCYLDSDHLFQACRQNNLEMVNYILDGGIKPNAQCFKSICTLFWPNQKSIKQERIIQSQIIDALIHHNYIITYKDLTTAIAYHVKINNLQNLNIQIETSYPTICEKASFYPHNFLITTKELKKECKKNNATAIRQIVGNGLIPDYECLKAACESCALSTVKFLIKKGNLLPLQDCLEIAISADNNSVVGFLTGL